jgi:hypothetical protein
MKDLFEDAVGVAPPSTVDVNRLIARRTRIQRWHRAGQVGLAVAAVAAIGAGTTLLPAGNGWPTATAPDGSASPTVTPHPVEVRDAARIARLKSALRAIVAQRLPGMTVERLDMGWGQTQAYGRPASASAQSPGPQHMIEPEGWLYHFQVTVIGPDRTAMFSGMVGSEVLEATQQAIDAHPKLQCSASPPGTMSCEVFTGPRGERVARRVSGSGPDGAQKGTDNDVWVLQPDRTSVLIASPWNGSYHSSAADVDKPLLTMDELTAIATDPRLTWNA